MSRIRIKNFGPIKEGYLENDGWMDINKVTVFIGNQGSGKSTVAKAISTMVWLEKALNRGDFKEEPGTLNSFQKLFEYQRLGEEYFSDYTEIEYEGDLYSIRYVPRNQYPMVQKMSRGNYKVPKIMYIPAERNFLSVVRNAFEVTGLPDSLFEFAEELRKAQKELRGKELKLPLNGYAYYYNDREDRSYLIGKNYKIDLLEASSGFQSIIPLYVVSKALTEFIISNPLQAPNLSVDRSLRMNELISDIMLNPSLSGDEKLERVEEIRHKYQPDAFINIVEEPEQNLYPTSQQEVLYSLLAFNNTNKSNKLVLTSHSPYIINYLTLAVKANILLNQVKSGDDLANLNAIYPIDSTISSDDIVIFQLDDIGNITKLKTVEGMPSDRNYLNKIIGDTSKQFDELLEFEDDI